MESMPGDEKLSATTLARLRAPLGGQEIELQQIDYLVGGMSLLRIRIREGRRHTVFDIDAATAGAWAETMLQWSRENSPASDDTL